MIRFVLNKDLQVHPVIDTMLVLLRKDKHVHHNMSVVNWSIIEVPLKAKFNRCERDVTSVEISTVKIKFATTEVSLLSFVLC